MMKSIAELTTLEFADEVCNTILHTMTAHSRFGNEPSDSIRRFDKKTPYAVHPIWCAMTVLTETDLEPALRHVGYQALAWHDILEDTTSGLPQDVDDKVKELVEQLTFGKDEDDRALIWARSSEAKLLKLYDVVSNLLDGRPWRAVPSWNALVKHALKLTEFVEGEFGNLNIVRIARAIAVIR
jgi:hypothetical protein